MINNRQYKAVKGFDGEMELVKVVKNDCGDEIEQEVTLFDYIIDKIKTGNRLIDEYELDTYQIADYDDREDY